MWEHEQHPDNCWRRMVTYQGRTIRWLAQQTNRSPRTLYAYSRGTLPPTKAWLDAASRALGVPVVR